MIGRETSSPRLSRRMVLAGLAALAPGMLVFAEDTLDPRLMAVADQFALAHILTGDAAVDDMAAAGLRGLSRQLTARTTVEPGPPVAIDLDHDDISVLSLLYWPVTDSQELPSSAGYLALDRWMRNGGLLLVDSRDADLADPGQVTASPALQNLLAPLDVPVLEPIPTDHVLTRSYYLLESFPGRHDGARPWVAAGAMLNDSGADQGALSAHAQNDGVTPLVIGGNAWADAWAVDRDGFPLSAIGSGPEAERQREMAYRFGINLVMVALTGNYKSDQVHVQSILDRLGRAGDQTADEDFP